MEINITWNICRVCLKEEQKIPLGGTNIEPMRHLFNEDKVLAKQIFECSGITMKPNDSLPEKICKKCLVMVKNAVNFRKTCRTSDIYLQSLLERTKSASTLFKPQWNPVEDFDDDDGISYENNESEELEAEETKASRVSDCQKETSKRKGSDLTKSPKKLCQQSNSTEINTNSLNLVVLEDELQEENDMVELNNVVEEILDHADADESVTIINKKLVEIQDEDHKKIKQKLILPQDFIIQENDQDFEEATDTDIKDNNDQFYYVVKDEVITQAQEQNSNDKLQLQSEETEDDNVQYIPDEDEDNDDEQVGKEEGDVVDEEQLLHLNSDTEDNQAQVTSTSINQEDEEEIEQNEYIIDEDQSSNLSNATNNLQTEYIVDEYLLDDSNSNISSRTSSLLVVNSKAPNKNRAKTILPERKIKRYQTKATTSSSSTAKIVGGIQVWVCDLCGNHFSNRQLLNAHMKVHRQEKNHECEICSKRFITACNLQAHMRIHTGEKPFECQHCGRRFSDRSSNLRHERIHTNEKPFQCNICLKAFSLSTTLKKHMKVHTGERSYRCDPCAKSFKLPHQLKAHKNTTLHKAVEQLELIQN